MKVQFPNHNKRKFPEFIIVKASAGTGKTRALTLRYTQFLLSENIRHNHPRQILAITFTRNAAKEMKERILTWLKSCYFAIESSELEPVLEEIPGTLEQVRRRAEIVLDLLLKNFSDFQVMTIDSFMTDVFQASVAELGLSPDIQIILNSQPVISYAHSRLLRNLKPGSQEDEYFSEIIRNFEEMRGSNDAFIWDPAEKLEDFFLKLNRKMAGSNRRPVLYDMAELRQKLNDLEQKFIKELNQLREKIYRCTAQRRGNCALWKKLDRNRIRDWFEHEFNTLPFSETPQEIVQHIENIEAIINNYKKLHTRYFYQPHLKIYELFLKILNQVKKEQGLVFLEDVHCYLANYLENGVVPDIYLSLGGRIYHYLIDEFQDTSPLQWQNLYPLIENALSQGGSLFLVGDTKQAIYSFREADYRIMMNLINGTDGFLSVKPQVKELIHNRRSQPEILNWVNRIFLEGIKSLPEKTTDFEDSGKWKQAAARSGLDDFICQAAPLSDSDEKGYVKFKFLKLEKNNPQGEPSENTENNSEENQDAETPEKKEVQKLIEKLKKRGYRYSDMAVLAYENEKVKEAASWLNEKGIPFVPYSALDIRKRQIIREILAFLQFLDYPLDDLNFSVFLLGNLFQTRLVKDGITLGLKTFQYFIFESTVAGKLPLYSSFREEFPELWDRYFDIFFRTTGFLPLYDLVSQIYRVFNPFEIFPEEEGSLIKLLEVILNSEGEGKNNLRDFIRFSYEPSDEQNIWTIDVPENIEAVKLMTIHKAKGLGFPVVILLLYTEQTKYEEFYLKKVSDSAGAAYGSKIEPVEVLKISANTASASPELDTIYQDYKERDRVNKLNTLYVALTRAEKELYVIGVKKNKTFQYPFKLFELIFNKKIPFELTSDYPEPEVKIRPHKQENIFPIRLLPSRVIEEPAVEKYLSYEETRLGEILHAMLAEIEYLKEDLELMLEDIEKKLLRAGLAGPGELRSLSQTLRTFLSQKEVAEYFRPRTGRQVAREMELVDRQGHLFRADRVIIDPDRITVIDFKSGQGTAEEKAEHYKQVKNYINILQDIFPDRATTGLLMYPFSNRVEMVQ